MNDEQLQRWLDQHGGEVGRKDNEKQEDGPPDPNTGTPTKRTTIDSTTITAKDGATLTLRRQPGPINNGQDYQRIEETPPKPTTTTTRTPEQQRADAANASKAEQDAAEAKRVADESSWNADPANRAKGGSGRYETHADRDARLAKEKADADTKARQARLDEEARAERNKPGAPTLKPDGKGGTIAVQTMPDGTIKTTPLPNVPSDKPQPQHIAVNGITYERDPSTGQYAPARGLPTEGEATSGGPPMPTIFLGETEKAARAYHAALAADPKLTPAQREKRFAEFIQVATVAQNEAITQQRERESQRNADYNTAATKLTYLENSTDSALKLVSDLNGKIAPGSSAGADAFVAMMGLQMLNLKLSGINNLKGAGSYTDAQRSQTPATPALTPADLSNPAAMSTRRAEIMANPVFKPQPPVNLPSQSVTAPPVPATAAPAAPQSGAAPAPSAPAVPPSRTPTPAEIHGESTVAPSMIPTPGDPNLAQPGDPVYDPNAAPPMKQETPDYGAPGMGILPQPPAEPAPVLNYGTPETMTPGAPIQVPGEAPGVSVPYPDSAGAVSMAPLPPALASLLPPAAPVHPPMGQQPDASQNPALLHVQAASKPVWAMSEDEYNRYKAAGVPDDVILGVPGRSAA